MENNSDAVKSKLEQEFHFAKKLYKRNFKPGKAFEEQEKKWERKRMARKCMPSYQPSSRPYRPHRRKRSQTLQNVGLCRNAELFMQTRDRDHERQEVNMIPPGLTAMRTWANLSHSHSDGIFEATQFSGERTNVSKQKTATTTVISDNRTIFHIPQSTIGQIGISSELQRQPRPVLQADLTKPETGFDVVCRTQIPDHFRTHIEVSQSQDLYSRDVSQVITMYTDHPPKPVVSSANSTNQQLRDTDRNLEYIAPSHPEQRRPGNYGTNPFSPHLVPRSPHNATDKYPLNATHKGAAKRKSGEVHKQPHKQVISMNEDDTSDILTEGKKSNKDENQIIAYECMKCNSGINLNSLSYNLEPAGDKDICCHQCLLASKEYDKVPEASPPYNNDGNKTFLKSKIDGGCLVRPSLHESITTSVPRKGGFMTASNTSKGSSDIIVTDQTHHQLVNFDNSASTSPKSDEVLVSRKLGVKSSPKAEVFNVNKGMDFSETVPLYFSTSETTLLSPGDTYHRNPNQPSTVLSDDRKPLQPHLDSNTIALKPTLHDGSFINLNEKESGRLGPQIIEVRGNVTNNQLVMNNKHKNLIPKSIRDETEINNDAVEMFDPKEICGGKLSQWNCSDVVCFLRETDCAKYADIFEEQDIDGKALILLTEDTLTRLLKIKIGPAIKIHRHVQNLKRALQNIEE